MKYIMAGTKRSLSQVKHFYAYIANKLKENYIQTMIRVSNLHLLLLALLFEVSGVLSGSHSLYIVKQGVPLLIIILNKYIQYIIG